MDLCSLEGFIWDGIKRDRPMWVGDLAPEAMELTAIYGRVPLLEKTLYLSRKIAPLPKYMNGDYGAHCYVGFRYSLCHGWSAGVVKFIKEHCHN
ncbi:MAG: hypothetical protein IJC87_00460 [Clostridia bacterium]|nr:hypothetical protein [Clostridia bacterium]